MARRLNCKSCFSTLEFRVKGNLSWYSPSDDNKSGFESSEAAHFTGSSPAETLSRSLQRQPDEISLTSGESDSQRKQFDIQLGGGARL